MGASTFFYPILKIFIRASGAFLRMSFSNPSRENMNSRLVYSSLAQISLFLSVQTSPTGLPATPVKNRQRLQEALPGYRREMAELVRAKARRG